MLDEPILGPGVDAPFLVPAEEPAVLQSIQALVHHEPFAVLCTQAGGQPYGSLVAFAFSEDLESFVFATPVATRKYRLLSECNHVALLVDNRGRFPADMMKVSAVTVTGRAIQVQPGADFGRWAGLLTARHPYLKAFVRAPSTALFRVDVVRYLHVTRFQEVRQWIPASDG
ncbi:MAG: pyridoxamine 5'-phosphate oxidase family protein [Anaerolineae bacterium]|nr:pyridoxamine 5'-phosphate oxidase family protein [Anaerolineae bacterium]